MFIKVGKKVWREKWWENETVGKMLDLVKTYYLYMKFSNNNFF